MLRKASFHQIPKIMLQSAWLNNSIELKNIYIWAFLNSESHMTSDQVTFLRQEEKKDPGNKVGSSFP